MTSKPLSGLPPEKRKSFGEQIAEKWPRFKKYAMKKIGNIRRPVAQNTAKLLKDEYGIDPTKFSFVVPRAKQTEEGMIRRDEVEVRPRSRDVEISSREKRIAETILDSELGHALWIATADTLTQLGMKMGEEKSRKGGREW